MKVILALLCLALVTTLAVPRTSLAKEKVESNDSGIAEADGDYQDPVDSRVRVRVFVHKAKNPATIGLLSCDDPDSNSVVGWAGWKLPTGTWTYKINTSSVPTTVGSFNFSNIISNGFNAWAVAQNKVVFNAGGVTTKTRSSYDRENIITWGRTSGSALGVTYVRYYSSTRLVVDVDTILNKKYAWSWNGGDASICGDPNSYDAQNILTHELGHWLGLDDFYSSDFINNTMYGYGSLGETKKNTLTTGDIAGIGAIYP